MLFLAAMLMAGDPQPLAAGPLGDVDFDLRNTHLAGEIVVTAPRERWRLKREGPIFELPPPPRLGFSIGNARIAPDAVQGRLGDAQVHVGLTIPF